MIYYMSPGSPATLSGGTRKLYDHVAILNRYGLEARVVHAPGVEFDRIRPRKGQRPSPRRRWFNPAEDVVVVPEVYGDGIRDYIPVGWRRIVFVQNSYITDYVDGVHVVVDPENNHPYTTCPDIIAIFTESAHSTDRLRARFPDLAVPIIRTHSSGNGRNGEDAGFTYGPWPRQRRIVYFQYKHEDDNAAVFTDLSLPDGWDVVCMTGMSDAEIAEQYRAAAIFAAANRIEGMCAPTSEAMISGCVVCCWTGGGPDEYLLGRAVIARQDDVGSLRDALGRAARSIDRSPDWWGTETREWSDWFQATYSREREESEIVEIFKEIL